VSFYPECFRRGNEAKEAKKAKKEAKKRSKQGQNPGMKERKRQVFSHIRTWIL